MLKQGLNQKLLQKLSPQQIQFIQLLQLNTTELERRVDEEITQNPALEMDKDDNKDDDSSSIESDSNDDTYSLDEELEGYQQDSDLDISEYVGDDDDYSLYSTPRDPNEEHKDIPIANQSSVYENLEEQIGAMKLSEREKVLASHLIGMIDEDGYLRRPLKNVAYDMVFLYNLKTDEEELQGILNLIQTLDPPGIGARSLQECLLIQLRRKNTSDENHQMAYRIIEDLLDELSKKHYQKIMKSLKIERDKLKEVLDVITHLNPKPGEGQLGSGARTQYTTPDFIVTNIDEELHITLNSKNAPELKVSKDYHETLMGYQQGDKKDTALKKQVQFIKQRLDNAKWFIDAIKQRQNTLLMTMRTIVALQKDFFLTGDITKLNPMILKDVADRIQMDISTVSRVVNSKYVETVFGIFSLKEFFSEGIQTDEGVEVSNKEVKQILQDFIENEDKNRPLTDEKLTDLLNERGYNIARRTVAKYREQLNIPVARLRKEL